MAHHRPPSSSSSSSSSSCVFGDTAFTKVFVGGLAWETQCDTMRRYFQQFGDILEAVVIVDKHTGRSKGYGFVTFRDPEAARRACLDPSPIIDGRRANCNLASLGAQRSRPSTPLHGGRFRPVSPHTGAPQPALPTPPFSQPMPFAFQQGLPYPPFVYPPYPPEYYPPNLYNPFAGAQFSVMYGAPGPLGSPTMYPPPSIQLPPIQPGFGMPHAQLLPYGSQALGGFTISNMHPGPSPGHMSPGAGPGPPPPPFVLPASSPQPFNSGGPPNSRQVE